jgi:putative SOS response-associated peptidase YedK
MCGRFTQSDTWREIRDRYDLTGAARNLQARLQHRADRHHRCREARRWRRQRACAGAMGLIPYWWKKPVKQLPATNNARPLIPR